MEGGFAGAATWSVLAVRRDDQDAAARLHRTCHSLIGQHFVSSNVANACEPALGVGLNFLDLVLARDDHDVFVSGIGPKRRAAE